MVSPLSQVPFGLTHSPKLYSGGIFREGWVLVIAASLYSFAIMGERSFIALFKQLTITFLCLIWWQQHQPHGTGSVEAGSVEEAHLPPSPSYLTPACITHAPFPTSTMCLDTESTLDAGTFLSKSLWVQMVQWCVPSLCATCRCPFS